MLEVVIAPQEKCEDVWKLFLEYSRELSQFDGETRPRKKRHYRYFDLYWETDDRVPFVIINDHEPIGFCLMHDAGISYNIDDFYVRPLHRCRGFGRTAVEHIKEYCCELGRHDTISANVYVNNIPAINFWKSVGFVDTGRRVRIKSVRMIEMEFDCKDYIRQE